MPELPRTGLKTAGILLALCLTLQAPEALSQVKHDKPAGTTGAQKSSKAGEKAPEKTPDKPSEKAADDKKKAEEKKDSKAEAKPAPEPIIENVVNVQAEDLVRTPADYLGKNIRFSAQFWNFSSVALDYKPAMFSSKDYFSFLVLRPNSHVPLSELKLAMKIPKDEKDPNSKLLQSLKDKDEVEVTGKVTSVALDEPWVQVLKVKRLKAAPEEKKDEKSDKDKSGKDN